MSDSGDDKSNTPRTDIIAGLWGGGDATIRRQLRRMEDHARQLENELSLAERRLATSEKCRNNLAASIPSSIGLTPKEGHCLLQVPQQTTEKPSPCAMAGYCLNTDAKAMPSAIESQPKCLLCGATSEAGCMKIPCPLAARSSMNELEDQRGNLAMLVRTLVHSLRRHDKTSGPAERAMEYLSRKGLQGSILRDAHDDIGESRG